MTSKYKAKRGKSVAKKGKSPPGKGKGKVTAPIASAPSKLLQIPPEVRLLIHDIYFSSPSYGKEFRKTNPFGGCTIGGVDASLIGALMDRFESAKEGDRPQRARSNINLLSVCRLIHWEAIPRFYRHHLFQLPTYSNICFGSAATPIKPFVIPSAITTHFDLIHRLEVVHQHLGDTIADRQNTDLAIAALLKTISSLCRSLRCLSIRVVCDFHYEQRFFEESSSGGDLPLLGFRAEDSRIIGYANAAIAKPRPVVGHPEMPPKAFSGTWSWTWHDDESQDEAGKENKEGEAEKEEDEKEEEEKKEESEEDEEDEEGEKGKEASMKGWGVRFFTQRPGMSSEVPSMEEVRQDSLYEIASLEPFAHWYDPEMG